MKKFLSILLIILSMNVLSFGYEEHYKKVYTVKISTKEIFKEINATEKQQKKLVNIFDNYQIKAKKIEEKLLKYEEKKAELSKLEKERYLEIKNILTSTQLNLFNQYLNNKKIEFEKKNNKVTKMLENLNLTNEQKAKILKEERDFQRNANKLDVKKLSLEEFAREYEKLQNNRNEKIKSILTENQIEIMENGKI